jgi:thioredoxin 2
MDGPMKADDRGILVSCASCGSTNRLTYPTLDRRARCGKCHAALPPSSEPIEAGGASFDALIAAASIPVVVDFWAPCCGPCRAMAPELEKVAATLAGEALIVKVNTEAEPGLGERFRIRSIPTIAVFRDGREITRASGARPAADIERMVAGTVAGR